MESKWLNFFKKVESNCFINIIDENSVEKNISIEMAERKFGIKWVEYDNASIDTYKKLQVRYMGEKLGWGLFAKEDFLADETIGILTGEVYFQDRNQKVTSTHVLLSDAPDNQFQVIDADYAGNLSRFIQHLPSSDNLDKIQFREAHIKEEVATCNIKHNLIELQKSIVTERYSALRNIKAGEILGANYALQFWSEEKPLLFKKNGDIIEENAYSYSSIAMTLK